MCVGNVEAFEKKFWQKVAREGFPKLFDLYSKKEITKEEIKEIFKFAIGETDRINKKILKKIVD